MRPIAINLAQFHEMGINNLWWGKGFTDWTKVKRATPLYPGHQQPKVPLDKNYYDMTQRETILRQTQLMERSGIYGMAYYHYWYGNQPLMHKAIDNLLHWTDIPQRFMLYWSNCDWYHSEATNYQREIMLRQEYGDYEDWITHIRYLIPFFQDPRYILVDGKPVLCIYRPGELPDHKRMMACFREECKKAGLPGLYIVETIFNYAEDPHFDCSDAVLYREPNCCKKFVPKETVFGNSEDPAFASPLIPKQLPVYQYEDMVSTSLAKQASITTAKKHYHSAFTGWDNTPRHGYKGYVVDNCTPEIFKEYMTGLAALAEEDSDFVFINAWNEWAEGMYLEPCETHKYGYLDAVRAVMDGDTTSQVKGKPNYRDQLIEKLSQTPNILLYGAGIYGIEVLNFIRKNLCNGTDAVSAFIDDTPNKIGTTVNDIQVMRPDIGLAAFPDSLILLCCDERGHSTMTDKLLSMGIPKEQILVPEIAFLDFDEDPHFIRTFENEIRCIGEMVSDGLSKKVLHNVMKYRMTHDSRLLDAISENDCCRYFDKDLLNGAGKGSYLDCGSYRGDSLEGYLQYCGTEIGNIICCEPDIENYKHLCNFVDTLGIGDIRLVNKGVWHTAGVFPFAATGDKSGSIMDTGTQSIEVDTVDHLIGDGALDFLKIEVNGAEYEVLLGACQVIRRETPVIAVSVYHNREDILRIPLLLKALFPQYRLYLRYYGAKTLTDIVCYAIPCKEKDQWI